MIRTTFLWRYLVSELPKADVGEWRILSQRTAAIKLFKSAFADLHEANDGSSGTDT